MTPEQIAAQGSEDAHQMAIIQWTRLNMRRFPELEWLYACPNGGSRDKREASKMKATGTKAGVADLFLPVPRHGMHGLYIEMKRPAERRENNPMAGASPKQLEFRDFVKEQGYGWSLCYSWEEAVDILERYLS